MSRVLHFVQADWPIVLRFTAISWSCFVVIAIGQAQFAGWASIIERWLMLAPIVFLATFAIRAGWFFATYALIYSRTMTFEQAYERFAARRPA